MSAREAIRRLGPEDAAALVALRREALEEAPLAFSSSPEDDRVSLDFARTILSDVQEQALFGHFEEGRLAGMVGVLRAAKRKERHKADLYGLYVTPAARKKGVGRSLLDAAVGHVREWQGVEQLHLCVTTGAPAAARLYRAAGFREWGRQPRALQSGGVFVDDLHFVLELRGSADAPPNLDELLSKVRRSNTHAEVDSGPAVGREA